VESLATNAGARVLAIGNPDDGAAHFAMVDTSFGSTKDHQLKELAGRFETAGCAVDTSGSSWLDASRFPVRKFGSDHSQGEETSG
jgi:hypothetical protein